jgi:hypothetical protein
MKRIDAAFLIRLTSRHHREQQLNEAQKTLIRFGGVARGFLSVTCFLLRPRADGDGVFTVMRIGCAMRNAKTWLPNAGNIRACRVAGR